MTRFILPAFAVAALALAACDPAERPPEDDQRPDPAPALTEDETDREVGADPVTDPDADGSEAEADARAYFEANYAGRWGMSTACQPEGMFTLTADRFALYEIVCDITELGREGDRVWGRTAECSAEGDTIPARTITVTAAGEDQITLEDGHYDWTRFRCESA